MAAERTCRVDGCARTDLKVKAVGLCVLHYQRWKRHGDPLIVSARGNHRKRVAQVKECRIDGCSNPVYGRGWCNKHWARWYRNGDPMLVKPTVVRAKGPRASRAR